MVSICERSITVVIFDKPKALTGLGQNGTVVRYRSSKSLLSWTPITTGEQSGSTPSSLPKTKHGKPVALPLGRPP
jgi:hypothetical protein